MPCIPGAGNESSMWRSSSERECPPDLKGYPKEIAFFVVLYRNIFKFAANILNKIPEAKQKQGIGAEAAIKQHSLLLMHWNNSLRNWPRN